MLWLKVHLKCIEDTMKSFSVSVLKGLLETFVAILIIRFSRLCFFTSDTFII